MVNRELDKLLEKIDGVKRASALTSDDLDLIVKLIKEQPKKARQAGPAEGQRYWIVRPQHVARLLYSADVFDIEVDNYNDLYPEKRFAEAELRAKKLIRGVNKQRRELNEGKELSDRTHRIIFWPGSGLLDVWGSSDQAYLRDSAYPFGLFKDSADCEMCVHEFEDELKWFYKDYLQLMEELDDYDWADAPGWRE